LEGKAYPKGNGQQELEAPSWFREQDASFSQDAVLLLCSTKELEEEKVSE
jgi:hypothetical protein